ncbi:MAG: alpha/beta hydrolase-fold protein [Pirellulales bacterium]
MSYRCWAMVFVAIQHCCLSLGAQDVEVTRIADRINQVAFASRAFDERKHFCVVLPSNYDSTQADWPVLYFLHGRGRSDRSLIDVPSTRDALLSASFVTVLPNGEDGWYLDSPVNAKNLYARLLGEVIDVVETKYHVSRKPQLRAIAGWSMGGYGSLHIAATHPKEFALVASIIGLIDFPRAGLPEGQSYVVPTATFGSSEADWKKLNPLNSAEKLRGAKVLLIAADQAFDRTMNENCRDRLRQLQIEHEWIMLRGGHQFEVVQKAVPMVIERVQAKFGEAASVDRR